MATKTVSFAPGPWTSEVHPICDEEPSLFGTITDANGERVVYLCEGENEDPEQVKANANLMAAAPNRTGFIGVRVERNGFRGRVTVSGRSFHTPIVSTAELAARLRDELAAAHHGEFVRRNFSERGDQ